MGIAEAIRGLRVVRAIEDRPLAGEDLDAIIRAGRRAGSSRNQQRLAFVVITERDRLRAVSGSPGAAEPV